MVRLPISVVVPVKNMEDTLAACLTSIANNHPCEVILIDGGSTDKSVEVGRNYTERIFFDGGRGPSYAHQLGLERATQEYIAFVDADIILPRDALLQMLREMEKGGFQLIQARWTSADSSSYLVRAQDWQAKNLAARKTGGLSAALLHRNSALKVGFDPSITTPGDDYDFLFRLRNMGYRIGNSAVHVFHHHRPLLRTLVSRHIQLGQGYLPLIRKHGLRLDLLVPAIAAYWITFSFASRKPQYLPYLIVVFSSQVVGLFLPRS